MDAPALFDLLADGPVIAAVKDGDGLSAALESSVPVIFLLYGDILTVGEAAARCHAAGKAVFVHLDLVEGLAQKEIAAVLGIDQRVYSNYETGKREIPSHMLITLADYYHTSVDYILGRK